MNDEKVRKQTNRGRTVLMPAQLKLTASRSEQFDKIADYLEKTFGMPIGCVCCQPHRELDQLFSVSFWFKRQDYIQQTYQPEPEVEIQQDDPEDAEPKKKWFRW